MNRNVSSLIGLAAFIVLPVAAAAGPLAAAAGPLDTLQPGEWYMAPNTNVSALDPCPARNCSYSGTDGQANMMGAWNGGAYDTTRDRLIVWGGGHNDYGGNEIYTFDIATMAWSMVIGPTITTPADRSDGPGTNSTNYYHDGRPASRHTANALEYAANVDRFFSLAVGATYGSNPGQGFNVDSFDFNSNTWKTDWEIGPGNVYGSNGTIAAYHPGTGKIWYHASLNSPLAEFDPQAAGGIGSWTVYSSDYVEILSAVLLDPQRNRFVSLGAWGGVRKLFVWDLNNPNNPPTSPSTSGVQGGRDLESLTGVGFLYDPVGDRYIAWHGGTTVYALDPDTWAWSTVPLYSGNTVTPTPPNGQGTYGRMRYIPSKQAFILVNQTTENVYFFKLTAGGDLIFRDGFQ